MEYIDPDDLACDEVTDIDVDAGDDDPDQVDSAAVDQFAADVAAYVEATGYPVLEPGEMEPD